MFGRWRSIEKRKRALLKKVTDPVARKYLETPLPDKKFPPDAVEFLALDFETTGLKADSEAILSMGYAPVIRGRLLMSNCMHRVVRLNMTLPPETVVIHQITDDRMQAGMSLHETLHELVSHMTGRVLLVHYAGIERSFLQSAMRRVYGHELPFMLVDTLAIEKRRLDRLQQPIAPNQLRLANLRSHYHLPRYGAHNALEDALATAELFMAELNHMKENNSSLTLADILG